MLTLSSMENLIVPCNQQMAPVLKTMFGFVVVERMSLDDDMVKSETVSPGLGLSCGMYHLSHVVRKPVFVVSDLIRHNQAVQPH